MRGCFFLGDSLKKLQAFPKDVKIAIGHALDVAQKGGKVAYAKPMTGIGSGVMEVVEDHAGNTYRAVYTVKIVDSIYVLHAFQKKSKSGIKTPKHEIDVIEQRLKQLRQMLSDPPEARNHDGCDRKQRKYLCRFGP